MDSPILLQVLADTILFLHLLIVLFIVMGLVFILLGKMTAWTWVRNPWFRTVHLVAIGVVVIQSWFGVICPLTAWEMALRSRSEGREYIGSFLSHWIETLLYYRAPDWVFLVGYTVFGAIVAVSWYWVRPRPFRK